MLSSCSGAIACLNLVLLTEARFLVSASNWFVSGVETLLLGGACATVAYGIGQIIEEYIET